MMNPDDDIENEEFDGLQSYARKGMAQELAKKLGLLGDVPGADTDDQSADMADPNESIQPKPDEGGELGGSIPPELLEQVLAALTKGQ